MSIADEALGSLRRQQAIASAKDVPRQPTRALIEGWQDGMAQVRTQEGLTIASVIGNKAVSTGDVLPTATGAAIRAGNVTGDEPVENVFISARRPKILDTPLFLFKRIFDFPTYFNTDEVLAENRYIAGPFKKTNDYYPVAQAVSSRQRQIDRTPFQWVEKHSTEPQSKITAEILGEESNTIRFSGNQGVTQWPFITSGAAGIPSVTAKGRYETIFVPSVGMPVSIILDGSLTIDKLPGVDINLVFQIVATIIEVSPDDTDSPTGQRTIGQLVLEPWIYPENEPNQYPATITFSKFLHLRDDFEQLTNAQGDALPVFAEPTTGLQFYSFSESAWMPNAGLIAGRTYRINAAVEARAGIGTTVTHDIDIRFMRGQTQHYWISNSSAKVVGSIQEGYGDGPEGSLLEYLKASNIEFPEFFEEAAVVQGAQTLPEPVPGDWRGVYDIGFLAPPDYSEIDDECIKQLLDDPGANIHNEIVYIVDLDQDINGQPLRDACRGQAVTATAIAYTYQTTINSCTLTPTGDQYPVNVPALNSIRRDIRPFIGQGEDFRGLDIEEQELVAISFIPP